MRLQNTPDDGLPAMAMIPNKYVDSGMHSKVDTSHGAK
jgi:hypothetical protein